MTVKTTIKRIIETSGYTVRKRQPYIDVVPGAYNEDGLYSIHNHDFLGDEKFQRAYDRGVAANHHEDPNWRWRVHIGLWAAQSASLLPGDFVECGVNYGFLSSSIMLHLNWNSLGKTFYLMDTFQGVDERFLNESEQIHAKKNAHPTYYTKDVETVKANFREWERVHFIPGAIPETLSQVPDCRVAFMHIDMNCMAPEVAALDFFWEKLSPGAFVLLDDYAYPGHLDQKHGIDAVAAARGVTVASLPTGQGLLIKPARSGGNG